ncbi:MAG: hypothetical protein ACYCW6_11790 [Candidatus Xenobia bacterium]
MLVSMMRGVRIWLLLFLLTRLAVADAVGVAGRWHFDPDNFDRVQVWDNGTFIYYHYREGRLNTGFSGTWTCLDAKARCYSFEILHANPGGFDDLFSECRLSADGNTITPLGKAHLLRDPVVLRRDRSR